LKFALQSLHFTEPAPSYDSQCSLHHTSSLKDRRATARNEPLLKAHRLFNSLPSSIRFSEKKNKKLLKTNKWK